LNVTVNAPFFGLIDLRIKNARPEFAPISGSNETSISAGLLETAVIFSASPCPAKPTRIPRLPPPLTSQTLS
jgi:hypothetical protein